MILSASGDKTIGLWNAKSGGMLKRIEDNSNPVTCAKFSRLSDVESGKELKILKGHLNTVYDVKYFPDDQTIVSCLCDKTIRLWNVKSGDEIQILEGDSPVLCIDISADGNTIASGSDKSIRIWR
ncbi:WD repeat-containing protein [Reticulomyxa filosa]|uniref:WD repeat-containing protein n=1 Tax=Reticulomyxa filosa TaxID=46433 RepID=X6LDV8_RETFI|nr:WD repeat-containing protein [Reticulomyxa filosa]|eukprot:ETO00193.1 WD repeat-containing protein [Reticulomyxa filosa]